MASLTRLVFLGPPGSGKGTQAQRLSERAALTALSSGDTLRREIQLGTEIGRQAEAFVAGGSLAPDDIVTGVMLAAVSRIPRGAGFILDGFPRTVPQALALERGLTAEQAIQAVIDFRIADAAIVERTLSRRVCSKCGFTYNVRFFPPRVEGVCDHCGGAVIQRVDDSADVIRNRLETYRRQTAPLISHYQQRGLLRVLNADADAVAVERELSAIVDSDAGA